MKRIYLSAFGSGLGHITRIQEIATGLKTQHDELLYSSFDEALDLLRRNGEHVLDAPSIDLKWSEHGGFSGRDTFIRFPVAILSFMRQIGFEARNIRDFDPDLVISDSRLSTIVAGKMNRFPVVTILNQFKILFPPRFRLNAVSRFYERVASDVLGLLWSLSDEVLVPDLPPPYTISEANVSGSDLASRAKFVGFMSPRKAVGEESLITLRKNLGFDSRPLVFIQISGPSSTKTRFSKVALDVVPQLAKKYNVALSLGIPNGSVNPRRVHSGALVYEWCPIKDEIFAMSSLLVARSGHGTISQCIDAGKPAVLVPIYNHSEQIWNAQKFQKLGLGREIRSENLNTEILTTSIDESIEDASYKDRAQQLSLISKRYDGIATSLEIIESYLQRSVEKSR